MEDDSCEWYGLKRANSQATLGLMAMWIEKRIVEITLGCSGLCGLDWEQKNCLTLWRGTKNSGWVAFALLSSLLKGSCLFCGLELCSALCLRIQKSSPSLRS